MAIVLQKGQKTDITKTNPGIRSVIIGMGWNSGSVEIDIDAAAFALGANGKVETDNDFVFYNNSNWNNGAIIHTRNQNSSNGDREQLKIEISKIPVKVTKVAFTCTIYDFEKRAQSFGQVKNAYIRVVNGETNVEIARYNLDNNLSVETAVVVGELYRHNSEWKFNPIGSGYKGGLNALCSDFGVTVDEKPVPPKPVQNSANNGSSAGNQVNLGGGTITQNGQGQQTGGGKINLSKIELRKKGDKVNLSKSADNKFGKIVVNLQWSKGQKKVGLLGNMFNNNSGIDLDLGCMFELNDGYKSVVQSLGNRFGSFEQEPYIKLLSDDRTGDSAEGEFMWINGDKIKEFKRILVYAFIYEGVSNWSQADGVITVKQLHGPDIVVKLDEPRDGLGMCGAILIENINGEFRIQKIEQYYPSHRELDQAFGWGLRWVAGSK